MARLDQIYVYLQHIHTHTHIFGHPNMLKVKGYIPSHTYPFRTNNPSRFDSGRGLLHGLPWMWWQLGFKGLQGGASKAFEKY